MSDIVEEVRGIIEKLTLEHQRALLKYAQEASETENAEEKTDKPYLSNLDESVQES